MTSKPIRVLHLLNDVTDRGNGVVNAAIDIAIGQAEQGLAVAVCSAGGEYVELLESSGVRHFQLDQRRTPFRLLRAALRLRRIVRQFEPDILHAHMVTGLFLAWAQRTGVPLVSHVHNVHQRSSVAMKLAHRVITVSDAVAAYMEAQGIPGDRIRVVLCGALGSPRLPAIAQCPPTQLLQPAIVTVAGMNHRKGIIPLLAAFERVAGARHDAHLYIVGDGPDRAEFEERALRSPFFKRIHFHGFQRNPLPYMIAAHTFVLASIRESFGLVLTEARECGCAIIASDVDGIPEALDGGRAGLLVPPGDVAALADALSLLLENPAEHERLRAIAPTNLGRFSVARMAAETVSVYNELLRREKTPAREFVIEPAERV